MVPHGHTQPPAHIQIHVQYTAAPSATPLYFLEHAPAYIATPIRFLEHVNISTFTTRAPTFDLHLPTHSVAVMRRSRSCAGVLVQLPPLSSTSYLSCILDTSCKQTLLLAFWEVSTSKNTTEQYTIVCFHCIFHTATHYLLRHASTLFTTRYSAFLFAHRAGHARRLVERLGVGVKGSGRSGVRVCGVGEEGGA
jgi:hypothetical protein